MKISATVAGLMLVLIAGCTDLKPLQAQLEDLQQQVNKLQADLAKSANTAAAANKATAASVVTVDGEAKQAAAAAEANAKAIEALNSKIDQMFRKRPN